MTRLKKRLLRRVATASRDFSLLAPGDRVVVALSGGKDSYALMLLLDGVRRKVPFELELVAVHVDQGFPRSAADPIRAWCGDRGYALRVVERDHAAVIRDKLDAGETPCPLCSRLRRGVLYGTARELGAHKVALGHHREDLIETLLLNALYAGQLKSMAARLVIDAGDLTLVRPLLYCHEGELVDLAEEEGFPPDPGSGCGLAPERYRERVRALVEELHADNPKVKGNLFAALQNVRPSHLLDPSIARRGDPRGALAGGDHGGS